MTELEIESVYVRLLPSELRRIVVSEEGVSRVFKLDISSALLRLRRVRVAGRVEAVEDRGRVVEAIVSDSEGRARVRAWGERARELLDLKPGDIVEILGDLRVFRDEVCVALQLFRRIDEKQLQEYLNRLRQDRCVLTAKASRKSP